MNMNALETLFDGHRTLRAVIDCVLEGRLGRISSDSTRTPTVARLDLGCYAIFGGDPSRAESVSLVREVPAPRELLIPDAQAWRDLLVAIHRRRLTDRPMRTYATHGLKSARLRDQACILPAGFSLERMHVDAARQLDDSLVPHGMQVFPSPEALVEQGIGFIVLHDGVVAAQATSYALSSCKVEVAIATREAFRGRGLARAVGARMLLHCLEQGLEPEWSASNPVSKRLAVALGYRPGPLCDVFYLE